MRFDAKTEANLIMGRFATLTGTLKGIHGGLSGVKNAALKIVPEVEDLSRKWELTGAQKKEIAVEACLMFLARYGKGWTAWIPEPILRFLIGLAIERAVAAMNKLQDNAK